MANKGDRRWVISGFYDIQNGKNNFNNCIAKLGYTSCTCKTQKPWRYFTTMCTQKAFLHFYNHMYIFEIICTTPLYNVKHVKCLLFELVYNVLKYHINMMTA